MDVLAETLGVPESGLRLVGSVLASYPLALAHRWCFWGSSPTTQNIFFASTGMGLTYWCYGKDIIHSFICTLTQWAFLKVKFNATIPYSTFNQSSFLAIASIASH